MPAAPIPSNENLRLQALRQSDALNARPDPVMDEIVREAAEAADTPIALISFVTDTSQWFKASIGLDAKETSRDSAFCAWAIHNAELLWVEDATGDERFEDNPLVHGNPNIRHYAGAPVSTPDGYLLGTVCVIDTVPRAYDDKVAEKLRKLSTRVSEQLQLRKGVDQGDRLLIDFAK